MKAQVCSSVGLLGTGSRLAGRVVDNEILRDLCADAYDEEHSGDFATWVDRVTHIKERTYVEDGENAATLAIEASRRALDMAGVRPQELDLIVHASFTPTACVPGDHVLVADALGAASTPSYTLTSACAGSIDGMAMAYGMIASGAMRRILVVGSETISPVLDYSDPLTAILFGDGAGAVVLGRVDETSDGGMLPPYLGFEFNWENILMHNANLPFRARVVESGGNDSPPAVQREFLYMRGGQSVLRHAVTQMSRCVRRVLGYDGKASNGELEDTLARMRLIPHQANGRIVDGLKKKLGLPGERVTKVIHRSGNVSAASNLIALDFAMRTGNLEAEVDPETGKILAIREVRDPIRKGELLVLPSIGAGYRFGAVAFVNNLQFSA